MKNNNIGMKRVQTKSTVAINGPNKVETKKARRAHSSIFSRTRKDTHIDVLNKKDITNNIGQRSNERIYFAAKPLKTARYAMPCHAMLCTFH